MSKPVLTDEERAKTPSYIARHSCGLIVAAMVDDGTRPKDVANFVSDCIRSGDPVERVTVADVRAAEWCKCFDKPKIRRDGPAQQHTMELGI